MKIIDSEKHYISEYYIRKGYRPKWIGDILELNGEFRKLYSGISTREFISSLDIFLHDELQKRVSKKVKN